MSKKIMWTAVLLLAGTAAFSKGEEIALFGRKKESVKAAPTPAQQKPITYYCWPFDQKWASYNAWVNFLYWQPLEDNLEPAGVKKNLLFSGFVGEDTGYIVNMTFDFKPAFQVGFGVNFDYGAVDLRGEYTRFYATQSLSQSGQQSYPMQLDPATLLSFLNGISNAAGSLGGAFPFSFNETWNLRMNLGDLDLGLWQMRGKIVEAHPFVGLRTAFIDQDLQVSYTANLVNSLTSAGASVGTAGAQVNTTSWAIGPRGGIATNWKLGKGFKVYWNGAGDLLYTNYNWHGRAFANVPNPGSSDVGPVYYSSDVTQHHIATLRTHFDIDLGFKWGICFNENKTRFEFTAGYGFQVFFDQNMFRHFTTMIEEIGTIMGSPTTELIGVVSTPISTSPNGNLYIQGLKLGAEFAF